MKAIYDTLRDQNSNLTLAYSSCCGYENEITTLSAFSSLTMFFVMGIVEGVVVRDETMELSLNLLLALILGFKLEAMRNGWSAWGGGGYWWFYGTNDKGFGDWRGLTSRMLVVVCIITSPTTHKSCGHAYEMLYLERIVNRIYIC